MGRRGSLERRTQTLPGSPPPTLASGATAGPGRRGAPLGALQPALAPRHVLCHLTRPPPALTAPNRCPSCSNGVCVLSACGSESAGLRAQEGCLPAPHAWGPPSRLGRVQNLAGSQTVFQGALRVGRTGRGPGVGAELKVVGGAGAPTTLCSGGPATGAAAGSGGKPAVLHLAGGRGDLQHQGQAPPAPLSSWGLVESGSRVRKAHPRVGGAEGGRGRASVRPPRSPGCLPPGGPGRPLLQAVPDLQPELRRLGQPRAVHPDLPVAPALQPARYLAPRLPSPQRSCLLPALSVQNLPLPGQEGE